MKAQKRRLLSGLTGFGIFTILASLWMGIWMIPAMWVFLFFSRTLRQMIGLTDHYGNPVHFDKTE
jgi:hypothetical protein